MKEGDRLKAVATFAIFLLFFSFSVVEASHKLSHDPPGGGGGSGGGTSPDTGTVTAEEEGGGAPTPIVIIPVSPLGGDTIKKGVLTIVVKGFRGLNPESDMDIMATSDLFGMMTLLNNFEQRGSGVYGANVTLEKSLEKGVYAITLRGQKGSIFTERRLLITLDPTITISTSSKESYFQGERMFYEGSMQYFDGSSARNVSLEASFFAPNFFFTKNSSTDEWGTFAISYPISFAEPEGAWDVRLRARDSDGNAGEIILKTKVAMPEGVVFYMVSFLSPFKDAEFKRGSVVPITVEVKDESRLLEKATVEFKDPRGELLRLPEVRPGIYAVESPIPRDAPLGVWQLSTQALKTVDGITQAGGNRLAVNILPATIQLTLLQPTNFEFFAGQQIPLKARASYSDGSPVEKAILSVLIGNQTIPLLETDPGLYESTYLFSAADAAVAGLAFLPGEKIISGQLAVSAADVYGNRAALSPKAITLRLVGKAELALRLFYYTVVVRYWYLFAAGFLVIALITSPVLYHAHLHSSLKKTVMGEARLIEMQRDLQRKYFKHHTLSRTDYEKLMLEYREKSFGLKEKKLELQEKIGKKEFRKPQKKKKR